MSRIITELVCGSCGGKWEGYISFGHPENDFTYTWKCAHCGEENKHLVEEWISSKGDQRDVHIYPDAYRIIRILMGCGDVLTPMPLGNFNLRKIEDAELSEVFEGYLTLEDISGQLKERMGVEHIGVVYVWVESPTYGVIYEYGNYPGEEWRTHGKTNGFA